MHVECLPLMRHAIQCVCIGGHQCCILKRSVHRMKHQIERIPWIEVKAYIRSRRTIHVEERLLRSGYSVPLLRNSLYRKVNIVYPLPVRVVDNPIVVRLQLAAMLEEEVLCWTRCDLNILGNVHIKRVNQCVDRIFHVERITHFQWTLLATGLFCACFGWAKDRRDACLDYRVVVSSFWRCSGKEAYSEDGTTGLVEFLQLLKRGTTERGDGGENDGTESLRAYHQLVAFDTCVLNIFVVRDVVIPLMIG